MSFIFPKIIIFIFLAFGELKSNRYAHQSVLRSCMGETIDTLLSDRLRYSTTNNVCMCLSTYHWQLVQSPVFPISWK